MANRKHSLNIEGSMLLCCSLLGARTLQVMYSCEWVEETGATEGHEQYGYGGEDFLLFDLKNERWIAPVRQGHITKIKWDANVPKLKAKIHYLTHTCNEWLNKYVSNRRRMLQRTGIVVIVTT